MWSMKQEKCEEGGAEGRMSRKEKEEGKGGKSRKRK